MPSEESKRRAQRQLEELQRAFYGEQLHYESEREELKGSSDNTQEKLGLPQRELS